MPLPTRICPLVGVVERPRPPFAVGNTPETADADPRLTCPNCGSPPAPATNTLYCVPAAVDDKAELDPMTTPLLVNAETPVPPLATARVPVLRLLALIGGRSPEVRVLPLMTRPLPSVVIFV